MRFSDRVGITTPNDVLYLDSIPGPLRTGLWNAMHGLSFSKYRNMGYIYTKDAALANRVWTEFFQRSIDERPSQGRDMYKFVADWFRKAEWWRVYNYVEWYANSAYSRPAYARDSLNAALEGGRSGYRFIGGVLAPIADKVEMASIEAALSSADRHGFCGLKSHIERSISLLSRRPDPDYPNAIKEAISAVEGTVKLIAGQPKATLGGALSKIDSKVPIHGSLKKGFGAIYGYTSDEDGIRHAMLETSSRVDEADATYMAVACSAFVHYLLVKAEAAGVLSD